MKSFRTKVGNLFMNFCSFFPLQDKVVFCCFNGNNCGDNPYLIFKEMKKKYPHFKYIWMMRNTNITIEGAKVERFVSFKSLFHLATAILWIDNTRKPSWFVKRKGQYYVQTWHGDVCIKKIEKDAESTLDEEYVLEAKHDSKMCDLMLSGSSFRTDNYKSSFWYDGEILEYGTPQAEIFYYNPEPIKEKIKNYYGIPEDAYIALYCPTFRKNDSLDAYNIDFIKLQKSLAIRWPGKWYIVVRLHPNIRHLQNNIDYTDMIINGSDYVFTNELIVASEIIITDYSGCMFDALEAHKKVVLYASDIDNYLEHERGMYFDIHKMPFPLTTTNSGLAKAIIEFDENEYKTATEQFRRIIGYKTTKGSTEKIVDYIYNKIKGASNS